jgi:hypothetical protein
MIAMSQSAMNPRSRKGRPITRATGRAAVAILALLMAACASPTKSASSVEARAQARWDALLARDYDTAYSLYSPGYRSAQSRVDFELAIRSRRIAWTAADVQESHCEEDACTVVTNVGYRIGSPVPGVPKWESEHRLEERWVRTKGQWWFVPDN